MSVMRCVWEPCVSLPAARRAVALGVFDGLHCGHRAVISAACGVADKNGQLLTATVLSMTGVPKNGLGCLLTPKREEKLLETLGADEWIALPFEAVHRLSPEEFVRKILCEQLQAHAVCCGYNYRFGNGGVGTADTLRQLCEPLGIAVTVIPSVQRDGKEISSTHVRQALAEGDMPQAAALLGRPFAVEFPVTDGDHRGRRWGMPTLNQIFPSGYAVPRYGVYASLVSVNGKQYRAVTNIGVHPTVGNVPCPQAETWIQEFDGTLYGQTVQVMLIRFLRDEQRFDGVETLKAQITADAAHAVSVLGGDGGHAVIFDFDDTLQDRTPAFCAAAAWLLKRHMPQADDQTRADYVRQLWAENNGGYVDYDAFFESAAAKLPFEDGVTGEQLLWEFRRIFPACSVLFPETEAVLKQLREKGYRIGILTNGNSLVQNRKLDITGVRLYVDLAVVSGDEPLQKPNPELFRRVAERLCVSPENCVFVGDHPRNDIDGARDAGMKAIFLNTRRLDVHPNGVPEVSRLSDVLPLL